MLRQFLCWHKWKLIRYHNNNPTIWLFKCTKCDKEDVWL